MKGLSPAEERRVTAGVLLQGSLLNSEKGDILHGTVYNGNAPVRDIVSRAAQLQSVRNEKTDLYRDKQKSDPQ